MVPQFYSYALLYAFTVVFCYISSNNDANTVHNNFVFQFGNVLLYIHSVCGIVFDCRDDCL